MGGGGVTRRALNFIVETFQHRPQTLRGGRGPQNAEKCWAIEKEGRRIFVCVLGAVGFRGGGIGVEVGMNLESQTREV